MPENILQFPQKNQQAEQVSDPVVDQEVMMKQQQAMMKQSLIEQRMNLLTVLALSTDPYFKDLPIMAQPSGVLDSNQKMGIVKASPAEVVNDLHVQEELEENLSALTLLDSGIITLKE